MRQTLVQLTDQLVAQLDARARADGVSRSRLIRDLLARALGEADELDRRLLEGYRRVPQHDCWGDLEAWAAANARRNLAALDGEDGGW